MGLIRAFLHAGATQVVVSQWPVQDLPTLLLMYRFYTLLMSAFTAAQALQQAQLWLRALTRAEVFALLAQLGQVANEVPDEKRPFQHAKYWAAFVLVGG